MKPDLQRLPQPWMTAGPAAAVMRALTAEGDEARFVGGCVRDALVGRHSRDIDIDGRHAKVEFTDNWQADAARRDLTINALSADAAGKVHDYFGGLDDLAAARGR